MIITAIEIPTPRTTFAVSESAGVGGFVEMGRPEDTEMTVEPGISIVPDPCPDMGPFGVVIELVIELGDVDVLWTGWFCVVVDGGVATTLPFDNHTP
jgi:hypothetical protein